MYAHITIPSTIHTVKLVAMQVHSVPLTLVIKRTPLLSTYCLLGTCSLPGLSLHFISPCTKIGVAVYGILNWPIEQVRNREANIGYKGYRWAKDTKQLILVVFYIQFGLTASMCAIAIVRGHAQIFVGVVTYISAYCLLGAYYLFTYCYKCMHF